MSSNRPLKITLITLIVLLAAAIGTIGYYIYNGNSFVPGGDMTDEDRFASAVFAEGISVDGIELGGLKYDEALEKIDDQNSTRMLGDKVLIQLDDKTAEIAAKDKILVASNASEVLNEAILLGNQGKKKDREEERARIAAEKLMLATMLDFVADDLEAEVRQAAEELSYPAVDATVEVDLNSPEKFAFTESMQGKRVDADKLWELVAAQVKSGNIGAPIEAPYDFVEPTVTVDTLKAENVKVSSFTTSFKKSSLSGEGRVHNIVKAASMINNVVLQPGEEFDMNKTLGDRTYETGWKGANGIRAGRYETEPGGGVCQVSTTLFNAVCMADLEIVDRKPHSWPLSYVSAGLDATISTGGPNFRFKNNKDTPIIIAATADQKNKSITVEIYGKPLPDGMTIKLKPERVSGIAKKETEYVLDTSMAPGTQEIYRESHTGSIHETYKEYYAGDKLIKRELAFKSTYPSISEIIYHGPAITTEPVLPVSQ